MDQTANHKFTGTYILKLFSRPQIVTVQQEQSIKNAVLYYANNLAPPSCSSVIKVAENLLHMSDPIDSKKDEQTTKLSRVWLERV